MTKEKLIKKYLVYREGQTMSALLRYGAIEKESSMFAMYYQFEMLMYQNEMEKLMDQIMDNKWLSDFYNASWA